MFPVKTLHNLVKFNITLMLVLFDVQSAVTTYAKPFNIQGLTVVWMMFVHMPIVLTAIFARLRNQDAILLCLICSISGFPL